MPNRRGLPAAFKTAKWQELLYSEFSWKNNNPVRKVSFCLKPNKYVL